MTVNNVSSIRSPSTPEVQSPWKQRAQDFKALQTALQSGDLSSAQQAFTVLQKDQPNPSPVTDSGQNPQAVKAFQALQSALSSGDLSGAQQAFASLKAGLQSAGRARHHHHHGSSVNPATPAANSTPDPAATPPAGSVLDVQA